ncbi:MAG: AMIN domain-containing protein, partial [Caulobacteraceae bacterium]|nr:AMIN domain-containing protein [Caulobacter sp.]
MTGAAAPRASAQDGVAPAAPVAVAARVERAAQGARLVFDLSRGVEAHAFALENPDRIVVEAPQINFQVDGALGRAPLGGSGIVKAFRFGNYAADRSRIVIDLAAPAQVTKLASNPIAGRDASHFVIQLGRTDRATFHQLAQRGAAEEARAAAPAAPAAPTTDTDRPVVVIDPGHGGIDPGASGLNGV